MSHRINLENEKILYRLNGLIDLRDAALPGRCSREWKDDRIVLRFRSARPGGQIESVELNQLYEQERDGAAYLLTRSVELPKGTLQKESLRISGTGVPITAPDHNLSQALIAQLEEGVGRQAELPMKDGYPLLEDVQHSWRVGIGPKRCGNYRYTGYGKRSSGGDLWPEEHWTEFYDERVSVGSNFSVETYACGGKDGRLTHPGEIEGYRIGVSEFIHDELGGQMFLGIELETKNWEVLNALHELAVGQLEAGKTRKEVIDEVARVAKEKNIDARIDK